MLKKLCLVAATLLLATNALAVDDVENLDSGTAKPKAKEKVVPLNGQSKGLGYKINFNDNKDASIHLWGLSRLYFYPKSSDQKVVMPYFRFYFDGVKDKSWSMHARLDYGQWVRGEYFKVNNLKPTDLTNGTPTFYYARAFVTYKPHANDKIKISGGRMLNQTVKYDVLDDFTAFDDSINYLPGMDAEAGLDSGGKEYDRGFNANFTNSSYQVGEGIRVEYQEGNFEASATVTYTTGSPAAADTVTKTSADPLQYGQTEEFFYGLYAGHKIKLGNQAKFEYGIGASTTTHNMRSPSYYELTPNLGYFNGGFYAIDQMMYRDMYAVNESKATDKDGNRIGTSDFKFLFRNHVELGYTIKKTTIDSYINTTYYDSDSTSNIGAESKYAFNPNLEVAFNAEFENAFNSDIKSADQKSDFFGKLDYYAYVNYYF